MTQRCAQVLFNKYARNDTVILVYGHEVQELGPCFDEASFLFLFSFWMGAFAIYWHMQRIFLNETLVSRNYEHSFLLGLRAIDFTT